MHALWATARQQEGGSNWVRPGCGPSPHDVGCRHTGTAAQAPVPADNPAAASTAAAPGFTKRRRRSSSSCSGGGSHGGADGLTGPSPWFPAATMYGMCWAKGSIESIKASQICRPHVNKVGGQQAHAHMSHGAVGCDALNTRCRVARPGHVSSLADAAHAKVAIHARVGSGW